MGIILIAILVLLLVGTLPTWRHSKSWGCYPSGGIGLVVFFLAFVLGLAGCQQEGTAEKAGQKIDQAAESAGKKVEKAGEAVVEKAGEYVDDSAITAKIKAEILSDPLLKVSQINVTTTNGVVRLSGTVDSQQSIDRAMEIARSVKDVKSVENGLVR